MADILVFGASGYTGRLTAHALHEAGASFALAGRNRDRLTALAAELGEPEVRIADAGDVDSLVTALSGCKVLVTTVGPFGRLGAAAVQAALRTGTHYVDSTGEGPFIGKLIEEHDADARAAGIAMCPAMGFDEVPGDVACALAAEGMTSPDIVVTYAVGRSASAGTIRSVVGLIAERGPWIEDGAKVEVGAGERERWAPMPAPLGPKSSRSFPLALARLAPRHLSPANFQTFVVTGRIEGTAMRLGVGALRVLPRGPIEKLVLTASRLLPEGPDEEARSSGGWTILVEARSGATWRNVAISGIDVYGLTARTLTAAAMYLATDPAVEPGVLSPVQALGVDRLRRCLQDHGAAIDVYAPTQ